MSLIDIAVNRIDRLLEEAADKDKDDIERCERYLEACSEAIRGLEQEYDEILIQAKNCNEESGEVTNLRERIDRYLHVDRLRPKLSDAIYGLSYYEEHLKTNAQRFIAWPWKKGDKIDAVKEFSRLLEQLGSYLKALNEQELPYRSSGTGIGIEALFSILNHLDTSSDFRTQSLRELAEIHISDRDKEPLFEYLRQIRLLIEELRHAFR